MVLQEEFERIGSPRTIKVDVRVIASTNRDLKTEIRNNRFWEDIFFGFQKLYVFLLHNVYGYSIFVYRILAYTSHGGGIT